ncbi:aminomethyl-transferring glycine dehydrogenase [Marinobacterium rhizophilum]|uniref:Glycine dehydrogenase (decarboxylating) n=1 Tax=Marinobacterium rhizophilum TaxID=420402 RepID=A0ABY5HEN7_9GAMM|nr:aminomethyl-transferring glycine dehydrogenase [Marinobacterium rhizophilum]UTW10816.1 aminomethyl-transferring glycine dehydrogenase [Marinobacterium rhizophilum]
MTVETRTLAQLEQRNEFTRRHVGPDTAEQQAMLAELGLDSLKTLIEHTVPDAIRLDDALAMDWGVSEIDALAELRVLASQNKVNKSYIGMGYSNTRVPNVIQRNVLENPAWYTAYTPYQPEIAQGRLEALLNFQQMVMDLTGMDLANASLLDEATAAAEAMTLCKRANSKKSNVFFVADDVHPQTLDVVKTRAEYFGYEVVVDAPEKLAQHDVFGVLLQYPGSQGDVRDIAALISQAKQQKAMTAVASDLLALVLLRSPGSLGADVVFGSSQRFGVPMGFGGPHAAFFAASARLKRSVPGRIIGQSIDSRGNPALRMAMQTREQHIRREKATSNICTAQALLANMASFYAVYHGPRGLKVIAERVHRLTAILATGLADRGVACNATYFDTLTFAADTATYQRALEAGCNLRNYPDGRLGISLDETSTAADVAQLLDILLGAGHGPDIAALDARITAGAATGIAADMRREDAILTHPTFNSYQSETEMLRYMKRLENKDYSLVHGMIPLGSCTMKLNATAQMIPVTWPEFANIHPFAPANQVTGYHSMIDQLEQMLVEITGYDAISMQPNSGAQGEYAGLLAIRKYQESIGEGHRNICLIPSSAHGTNPASAAMMGLKVVIVECDAEGNVDIADLTAKAQQHSDALSTLMITYPSTHGVFEEAIVDICRIIHQCGGQVYMDGANMNAQVGISKPGLIGSDVSHLNLHKTFAIPHGGGGPGMGPIGVKSHLAPFLPSHKVSPLDGLSQDNGAVAAAPFGSASILPITWMYIRALGKDGLKHSTELAILNANYLTAKLADHYPVLYRGRNAKVAHECILDIRPLKEASGVTEEDIAKRLMDYGFHAPTMSFPVAGTLMIEPTESESRLELDRFVEAMIGIRAEIQRVQDGSLPADNNPLCNAPHTQADLVADWQRPYSRDEAIFPTAATRAAKFWPSANRIDNVYGDRNFICSCPSIDAYRDE